MYSSRRAITIVATVVWLVTLASPAAAQTDAVSPLATSGEGLGVTFALQWTSPGLGVDYAKRLMDVGDIRSLNVVGELHLKYGPTHDDLAVLGGVRLARHNKRMPSPFVQVLAGLHTEFWDDGSGTDQAFRLQPGGGFNFRLRPNTLLRTQMDFPILFFDEAALYLRVSVGLEHHFGK